MRNSKLYSILEQFDKYEQNWCRKFLLSPYFNKDEVIVAIFDLLIEDLNNGKNKRLDKEYIWQLVLPGTEYDDVRFRKYVSDLIKLIEDFLCQQLYEQDSLLRAGHLIQAVTEKKVEKLYNSSVRNARKTSQEFPYRSASYYYYNYVIENNYYRLVDFETKRDLKSNFEDISNYLDYFYLAEKLRILCGILSRQTVTARDYNVLVSENEIIQLVRNNLDKYAEIPAISIYYQIYLTLSEPEEESHYFGLKEALNKYNRHFPQEVSLELYTLAQNYCTIKLNQGNQKFGRELFDLYVEMIDKKLLIVEDELSPWHFRNIITLALRLGEHAWAEHFINTNKHYLPDNMRDNAVSFNLALIYFYQKKYDKVKVLLQEVEFDDLTYNLGSKSMLLATFYETEETEPLFSLIESFRTYLNRHKDISSARRQNYANLIKFIKKLTKIMPGDKKSINKFKEELAANKNVASYSWLMEKIAEME